MTPAEVCAWPIMVFVGIYVVYVWIHELTNWFQEDDVV